MSDDSGLPDTPATATKGYPRTQSTAATEYRARWILLLAVAVVAAAACTRHTPGPPPPTTVAPPTVQLQPGPHAPLADVDLPAGAVFEGNSSDEERWRYGAPYDDRS